MKLSIITIIGFLLIGCLPNTYYSTTDNYVIGLRWHDRGDFKAALKYWEPLLKKGDCDAENSVANMYFRGTGKEQNLGKAIKLWKKAANGNQQKAQAMLGDLYNPNNDGIIFCKTCEKNIIQSYVWYKLFEKSAKYDGEKKYAKHIISKISATMTEEQIIKGNLLVSNWRPTPKDCGARNLW